MAPSHASGLFDKGLCGNAVVHPKHLALLSVFSDPKVLCPLNAMKLKQSLVLSSVKSCYLFHNILFSCLTPDKPPLFHCSTPDKLNS